MRSSIMLVRYWNGGRSCAFSGQDWSLEKIRLSVLIIFVNSQTFSCSVIMQVGIFSQSTSLPGDLSTDVARVGDVAGNMVGFNVSLYICQLAFFSTQSAGIGIFFIRPHKYFIVGSDDHGLDLLFQLVSLHTNQCT